MKSPLKELKTLLLLIGLTTTSVLSAVGQCTVVSSTGYTVHISITPTAILPDRNPCTAAPGYNYNVRYNYSVTFTGTNIPSNLYTLQTNIVCAGQTNGGYGIPTSGGTGTSTTTTNPWRPVADCNTVTVSICSAGQITIEGPGISSRTISCSLVLPIKLISFEGESAEDGAQLNWVTSMEKNFDYFTVERAGEDLKFRSLTQVEGKGGLAITTSYDYLDQSAQHGKNYYRLKSVDLDGTFEYSNVILVNRVGKTDGINVYPTLIDRSFTVELNDDFGSPVNLVLVNAVGNTLYKTELTADVSTIEIPAGVKPGVYLVKLFSPSVQKAVRVVVK